MRYLILLFFAIVLLNEPSPLVAHDGLAVAGDLGTSIDVLPTTPPVADVALAPRLEIDGIAIAPYQLLPLDQSPKVLPGVWYGKGSISAVAYPTLQPSRNLPLLLPRADRQGRLATEENNRATYSRMSREAVPRASL